jgi:hypothetical protein
MSKRKEVERLLLDLGLFRRQLPDAINMLESILGGPLRDEYNAGDLVSITRNNKNAGWVEFHIVARLVTFADGKLQIGFPFEAEPVDFDYFISGYAAEYYTVEKLEEKK